MLLGMTHFVKITDHLEHKMVSAETICECPFIQLTTINWHLQHSTMIPLLPASITTKRWLQWQPLPFSINLPIFSWWKLPSSSGLEENTLILFLHIPLVAKHNLMAIYEFINFPVDFNFSYTIFVTLDVGQNNHIAVRHT
jgi:hypothetical protein